MLGLKSTRHDKYVFNTGVVVMNPLAVYLDEHEAHSWRDTLKILGGAIAVSGFFYLATLIRPYILGINDSQYEVNICYLLWRIENVTRSKI